MFIARDISLKGVARGGWSIIRQPQSPHVARRGQSTIAAHGEQQHGSCQDQAGPVPQFYQPGDSQNESVVQSDPKRLGHGKRARRQREGYLTVSPALILAMHLGDEKSRNIAKKAKDFEAIALSRSLRLPVLTTQMLMMQEEARNPTSLSEALLTNNWDTRVKHLEYKGITKEQIVHWAWILSGETSDSRLERFLSTDQHKPIFLLLALLRPEETFKRRGDFVALLEYISKFYCTPREGPPNTQPRAIGMATDPRLNMTTHRFLMVLKRLVQHSLRLWPDLLEPIARLVTAYIMTIPTDNRFTTSWRKRPATPQVGYGARCEVFNAAIHLLAMTAPLNPLANAKYNWEAQKLMLAFSTGLERQLVLVQSSYWAIRSIIMGLEKSQAEEKVAVRSKKTWPPYREEWDGLDERRRPEDDLSRSVKAGILAREAGYPETDYDRALDALGGAILGESPTVQTRSMKPRLWKGKLAGFNIYTAWAARVKATRNAHEAWRIFEVPPEEGLKPNFQVYEEMFEKLLSRPVADPSSAVPGNAKEVFPPYEANLTAVEKARLQPPSVAELYDRMLQSGDRPDGRVLALLVANSHSEDMAMQYLQDSPHGSVASVLRESTLDAASSEALLEMPLGTFNAYISLLCKLHSSQYLSAASQSFVNPDSHIHRAIMLTSTRLAPNSQEGRTYKPPWHNIMRTLATTRTLFISRELENNHLETLSTVLELYEKAKDQTGMDAVLFEQLTFAVSRTMFAIFTDKKYPDFERRPDRTYRVSSVGSKWTPDTAAAFPLYAKELLQEAHSILVAGFNELVSPDQGGSPGDPDTTTPGPPRVVQIYRYMRVLGLYDDIPEMARVLRWIVRACYDGRFRGSATTLGTRDHAHMMDMLACFRALAEGRLSKKELRGFEESILELSEEKDIPWLWPQAVGDREDISQVENVAERWSLVLHPAWSS
ncbi:hypothetical protein QBC33DRAFT_541223 [Phialemonium atrogriseum]|uniref:Prefoldin subunit n=1 Tax=Phialemonium atrogriseum TaxID=1093897 RepID=A0AAJ0C0K2_9PEZI|nr:uncharacterized protein QBC33DRAFT_541223 [Phialemonium atrogriseum]KAK1766492.1 hypothetical protein QBC33DRAFT_541223 [Phialemonium atrogriseum]